MVVPVSNVLGHHIIIHALEREESLESGLQPLLTHNAGLESPEGTILTGRDIIKCFHKGFCPLTLPVLSLFSSKAQGCEEF